MKRVGGWSIFSYYSQQSVLMIHCVSIYRSIGKKLSSLMHSEEDYWISDLGLGSKDGPSLPAGHDRSQLRAGRKSSSSSSGFASYSKGSNGVYQNNSLNMGGRDEEDGIDHHHGRHREDDYEDDSGFSPSSSCNASINNRNNHGKNFNKVKKNSEAPPSGTTAASSSSSALSLTEAIRSDTPKRAISTPVINYTQAASAAAQRVEYNPPSAGQQQPMQIRRKSSELSQTMKSRLEAFTSETNLAAPLSEARKMAVVEPDCTFKEKLQTFKKISEGQVDKVEERRPRPPQSIGSLLAGVNISWDHFFLCCLNYLN